MSPFYSTNPDVYLDLYRANARDLERKACQFRQARGAKSNKTVLHRWRYHLGSLIISLGRQIQGHPSVPGHFPENLAASSAMK